MARGGGRALGLAAALVAGCHYPRIVALDATAAMDGARDGDARTVDATDAVAVDDARDARGAPDAADAADVADAVSSLDATHADVPMGVDVAVGRGDGAAADVAGTTDAWPPPGAMNLAVADCSMGVPDMTYWLLTPSGGGTVTNGGATGPDAGSAPCTVTCAENICTLYIFPSEVLASATYAASVWVRSDNMLTVTLNGTGGSLSGSGPIVPTRGQTWRSGPVHTNGTMSTPSITIDAEMGGAPTNPIFDVADVFLARVGP